VPEAVRRCIEAGITVRMVTGDNIDTAKKIAEQCSIYTPNTGGIAMIGPDFAKLTPGELDKILPKLQVLARSSPTDKHTLVKRLRKNNQIVAVTGDGTNDAPALKKAHVGLAMGIAGTEVAKLAADIIILDDNFTSIVKSVMWGRNIFDNIRKFLQFQLTINAVALIVSFIAAASRQGTPLKPIQLLWVNLIMDTLAALALATELPTEKLLKRKPINILQQRIINNAMIKHICGQGAYQVAILLILLYVGYKPFGIHPLTDHHFAIIFNAFVLCQVFNEINCRTVNDDLNVFEGIHRNVIFLGVIFLTVLFQVLIICFGGKAFHVVLLGWKEWITCIVIGALTLPLGLLLRLIPTPEKVNTALYNVDVQANMDAKADKKAAKKVAKANKVA
jgi:calcium-translocating P-type ATPase